MRGAASGDGASEGSERAGFPAQVLGTGATSQKQRASLEQEAPVLARLAPSNSGEWLPLFRETGKSLSPSLSHTHKLWTVSKDTWLAGTDLQGVQLLPASDSAVVLCGEHKPYYLTATLPLLQPTPDESTREVGKVGEQSTSSDKSSRRSRPGFPCVLPHPLGHRWAPL